MKPCFFLADVAYQSKVVYNARLVGALAKQVYVAEKLAPPTSVGEITTAWATALGKASSKDYWVKLQKSGEWKTFALYVSVFFSLDSLRGDGFG